MFTTVIYTLPNTSWPSHKKMIHFFLRNSIPSYVGFMSQSSQSPWIAGWNFQAFYPWCPKNALRAKYPEDSGDQGKRFTWVASKVRALSCRNVRFSSRSRHGRNFLRWLFNQKIIWVYYFWIKYNKHIHNETHSAELKLEASEWCIK